jgi:flagellar hook-associated protein 3 FlgL
MRVSSNSFSVDLKLQLGKLAERQARLQQQISTGQRITTASDDPKAMRRVLNLRNERSQLTQYQDNISTLRENANVVYSTVNAMKRLSDRASEIATLADGAKATVALSAYAKEVDQLLEETLRLSNTQHRDVYIFSGTKSKDTTYTATRDGEEKITAVNFEGNSNSAKIDVAFSTFVNGNYSAEGTHGILKNSANDADFITNLIALRDNLTTAADTSLTKDANHAALATIKDTVLGNLDKDEVNFIDHFSSIGAMLSRLETSEAITKSQVASIEPLISNEADADLADSLVRLNEIQNAYTAALQSGALLMRTSLLDYIR